MRVIPGGSLSSVPGIEVGHWTDHEALTGCTVVSLPYPNVITGEVRGAAPGTRETALLAPGMGVEQADAILLAGGTAFGLAAADGVMNELRIDGRGYETPEGRIPIVPAAVIYDLQVGDPSAAPDAAAGAAAFRSAGAHVGQGRIGAGAGATVSKWRGVFNTSGVGTAAVDVDGVTVGALVVVNAVGDVFSLEGESLTGGPHAPDVLAVEVPFGQNTTLAVVATDAGLPRSLLTRLAVRGQDAIAACLRPSHTRFDGDACFAVSCGDKELLVDNVAEAAFVAVGRAIESAVGISSEV